ncbi:MAG TPA: NAD-dependent epimerase/dehydratase family protein [Polyangiaceae bacterium]
MPKTAFVTGGTGFIGRHVVEQLTAAGWHVVALHRPSADVRHLKTYGVDLVEGSVTDAESIGRAMPPLCDAVFHIAGNTSLWSGGNAEQTLVNVTGTANIVQAAITKEARFLVHTSSVASWGRQSVIPFDETAPSNARESFINYVRTKYRSELEVEKGVSRGLKAVIMNPGQVLGRYDVTGWARLIRGVHQKKLPGVPPGAGSWASGEQVARAHIAAVDSGRVGDRYLLGGVDASYMDAIRIIGRLTDRKVPSKPIPSWALHAFGRVSQWASYVTRRAPQVTPEIAESTSGPPHFFKSDKAIRELGYAAVPLEDMLRESYDWLKAENLLDS